MSFFNDLGNHMSTMGNRISGKTKDVSDQLRLNSKIHKLENDVADHFRNLGELVYSESIGDENHQQECQEIVDQISSLKKEIGECQEQLVRLKSMVACPHCGKSVAGDAEICPYCGGRMDTTMKDAEYVPAEEKRKCPKCGAEVDADAMFCTACGTRLEPQAEENTAQSEEKSQQSFCENCGAPLMEGASFCTRCGKPVRKKTEKGNSEDEQKEGTEEEQSLEQNEPEQVDEGADLMQEEEQPDRGEQPDQEEEQAENDVPEDQT